MGFPVQSVNFTEAKVAFIEDNVRACVAISTASDHITIRQVNGETWSVRLIACSDGRVAAFRHVGGDTYDWLDIYPDTIKLARNIGSILSLPPLVYSAVDKTAPSVPIITKISDKATGLITDNFSPDVDLVIDGTADAGSFVKIKLGGLIHTVVQADDTGVWDYNINSGLSTGSHSFTVIGFDAANNASAESTATVKTVV